MASNRTSALPPLIIPQYDSDKYFGDIDVTVFDFNDVLLNDVLEDNSKRKGTTKIYFGYNLIFGYNFSDIDRNFGYILHFFE